MPVQPRTKRTPERRLSRGAKMLLPVSVGAGHWTEEATQWIGEQRAKETALLVAEVEKNGSI